MRFIKLNYKKKKKKKHKNPPIPDFPPSKKKKITKKKPRVQMNLSEFFRAVGSNHHFCLQYRIINYIEISFSYGRFPAQQRDGWSPG